MTITTTILGSGKTRPNGSKVVYGESVLADGVNTGDVDTTLYRIRHFRGTVKAAVASQCQTNVDYPLATGTVAIITGNINETVYWEAIGDPV